MWGLGRVPACYFGLGFALQNKAHLQHWFRCFLPFLVFFNSVTLEVTRINASLSAALLYVKSIAYSLNMSHFGWKETVIVSL